MQQSGNIVQLCNLYLVVVAESLQEQQLEVGY